MAARSAWRGAITFGGFPINVAAYNVIKSKSGDSFKSLCPCHHQPIVAPKVCAQTRDEIQTADLLKGVEISRDDVREVPADAVAKINDAERSTALDIKQLAPRASVPLHLATGHFRLVPDPKVPGSVKPVQILWNGLHTNERVLITEWVPRAGSRTQLVAIEADAFGLNLHVLPYVTDVQDTDEFKPEANEQAAAMFGTFAEAQGILMDDFTHTSYEDTYAQRRSALVEKALAGEKIEVPNAAEEKGEVVDLMAAMQASLDALKPAKKPKVKAPAKAAA